MNATEQIAAEDLAAIKRRVQKLLAIAQDDRANANEAAAAASQAEKIMRKYQLDHVEVMRADFAKPDNFSYVDAIVRMKMHNPLPPKVTPKWAQIISVALATLHDCIVSQVRTDRGVALRFSGYKSDAELCGWAFDYLTQAVIRSCREFQRTETRRKAESEAYRNGFVNAVTAILHAATAEKHAEQQQASTSRELVIVKMAAVAEKFGPARYKTGSAVRVNDRNAHAWTQGRKDGQRLDVHRRAIGG